MAFAPNIANNHTAAILAGNPTHLCFVICLAPSLISAASVRDVHRKWVA
jgi:hypothetical protein